MTELTGIAKFNSIAVFQNIARTTVVWRPSVYTVNPSRLIAAVKFIKVSDGLNIRGIVSRRKAVVKMYFFILAHPDEQIKYPP